MSAISLPSQKWRAQAACRGIRFFTELSIDDQKDWCLNCPVSVKCLDFALQTEPLTSSRDASEWPVYGGVTGDERQRMIRRLGKNRGRSV